MRNLIACGLVLAVSAAGAMASTPGQIAPLPPPVATAGPVAPTARPDPGTPAPLRVAPFTRTNKRVCPPIAPAPAQRAAPAGTECS